MRFRVLRFVALSWLAITTNASAEDDLDKTKRELSAGVESSPASWRLTETKARDLIAIFRDPTALRHVRLRALSALSRMKGESVRLFFVSLVSVNAKSAGGVDALDVTRSPLVLRRAIDALSSLDASDRMVEMVAPWIAHENVQVRAAVARALLRVRSAKAATLSKQRLLLETSPLVRRTLLALNSEGGR